MGQQQDAAPENPRNDVEVWMGTDEGQRLMHEYHRLKGRVLVALEEPHLDGSYETSYRATSPVSEFNNKADAVEALCGKGIDVGFKPLMAVSLRLFPERNKWEAAP